jgi:hypothetical protein
MVRRLISEAEAHSKPLDPWEGDAASAAYAQRTGLKER